jgi:ABC-type sugar transport system ATPase subunit
LRKTDAATIRRRVDEVAQTLDIEHLLDRYPRQLSGGQRQRVAMGRAIVRRPALFMFDEPLSNLDPALRTHVRVDIRKLHDEQGATSVYVTHDQVEAMTLADVLFVLNGGHVQQRGAPLQIYRRPANRFVAGFLGSPAMNFVPGRIDRTAEGTRVLVGADRSSALPIRALHEFEGLVPEREVVLGVRPHDVDIVADPLAADLVLDTTFVETLGSHVNLHGEVAGAPFIAALEGDDGPAKGERVGLRVTELHLFDASTGDALRS